MALCKVSRSNITNVTPTHVHSFDQLSRAYWASRKNVSATIFLCRTCLPFVAFNAQKIFVLHSKLSVTRWVELTLSSCFVFLSRRYCRLCEATYEDKAEKNFCDPRAFKMRTNDSIRQAMQDYVASGCNSDVRTATGYGKSALAELQGFDLAVQVRRCMFAHAYLVCLSYDAHITCPGRTVGVGSGNTSFKALTSSLNPAPLNRSPGAMFCIREVEMSCLRPILAQTPKPQYLVETLTCPFVITISFCYRSHFRCASRLC